jgi:hypothetical protein
MIVLIANPTGASAKVRLPPISRGITQALAIITVRILPLLQWLESAEP